MGAVCPPKDAWGKGVGSQPPTESHTTQRPSSPPAMMNAPSVCVWCVCVVCVCVFGVCVVCVFVVCVLCVCVCVCVCV